MALPNDLADCLVRNTVASSRALLKRWDVKLKPYGVTIQQFFLLAAIRFLPGQPVIALAEQIASTERASRAISIFFRTKALSNAFPAWRGTGEFAH